MDTQTETQVEPQIAKEPVIGEHAHAYFDWAPLVGIAVGMMQKQCPKAFAALGNCTGTLYGGNGRYEIIWSRYNDRVTLDHTGRWRWTYSSRRDGSKRTYFEGAVMPLHDQNWIGVMVSRDHDHKYARIAVGYFQKLMQERALARAA